MIINPKKDCPHVENSTLLDIDKFKKIPFDELKCQKCDESKELWICLICGEIYCSRYVKGHFVEHNKLNPDHCLCLGVIDLSIWCFECINNEQNNSNTETEKHPEEKGSYIESKKTNDYIKILSDFNIAKAKKENEITKKSREEIEKEIKNEKNKNDEKNNKYLKIENKKEICSHIKNEEITNDYKESFKDNFQFTIKMIDKFRKRMDFVGICLKCGERLYDNLEEHFNQNKHKLYVNILDLTIICMECKSKYYFEYMNDFKKYKYLFQYLYEYDSDLPKEVQLLTKEEINEIKYNALIKNFKNKKYSKILFMVGAGISTSAGIPDFRSNTGLFKQLQDKYKLSSPEEFFDKSTFLKNPMFFYEFTKIFDLSEVKATISHKFMNFFVSKNIVKYIFTQNIDGLEKKAKIPDEKLIFAHGNFYQGHCAKCDSSIDIEKINEGIQKGEIYYCPKCHGPCKPNVVFYGEGLPQRFFEKLNECKDVDLIIIMGTSLKVQPFASIPYVTNRNAYVVMFNMEEVGEFKYNEVSQDSIFIGGKTDKSIIKFLKDIDLYDEFAEFIKKEYNEQLENLVDKEIDIMNVYENEENKVEKLAGDIDKLNLDNKK